MDENVRAIQNMLFERWSNGACLGYVIRAMESVDFNEQEISLVVAELKELFDFVSLDEADKHYCNSPY